MKSPLLQNLEAEHGLLSLILSNPDLIDDLPTLIPLDFSGRRNREIYMSVLLLRDKGKPVDTAHVFDLVSRIDNPLTETDVKDAFNLEVPFGVHRQLFDLIRQRRILRNVLRFGTKVSEMATSFGVDDKIETLVDNVEKNALRIRLDMETGTEDSIDLAEILGGLAEMLRAEPEPEARSSSKVATGFSEIDSTIIGAADGDMVILMARPSVGKTAFMGQLSLNMSESAPVGVFTMEMDKDSFASRLASNISGVNWLAVEQNYVSAEERRDFLNALDDFPHDRIRIDDTAEMTVEQLKSKMRRMVSQHGVKTVFLDYFQLLKLPPGNDRPDAKYAEISKAIKGTLKELKIRAFVLAQLNRAIENREDKIPRMSDLRECGQLEQDADQIWGLVRPDGNSNPAFRVYSLKGRNTGLFEPAHLYFDTETQRITSHTPQGYISK